MGKLAARRADCAPLAGRSTLNRSSMRRAGRRRATTRSARRGMIERQIVERFSMRQDAAGGDRARPGRHREPLPAARRALVPRLFGCYCYRPLYVIVAHCRSRSCGGRTSTPATARSRRWRGWWPDQGRWPEMQFVLRADSGSARYTLLARASSIGSTMSSAWPATPAWWARSPRSCRRDGRGRADGSAGSLLRGLRYQTLDSWSSARRMVGRAEQLVDGAGEPKPNPRFVVTNLAAEA